MDTNAVQRHRNIILDCLRDGDISIRRRALELSYALINESNVRVLTRELLSFLEVADNEFKLGMTTQICLAAERFAPNKRWHIDTVLRVLKLAGNLRARRDPLGLHPSRLPHAELHAYTVQKLFSALHHDFSQESLTLAAVWVIGEFGDVLVQGGKFEDEELVREVQPKDVVDLLSSVLDSPYVKATSSSSCSPRWPSCIHGCRIRRSRAASSRSSAASRAVSRSRSSSAASNSRACAAGATSARVCSRACHRPRSSRPCSAP